MKKIYTDELSDRTTLNPNHTSWVYNGLDCCVTHEVFTALMQELADSPKNVQDTYKLALDKQGVFLEMSLRGMKVDKARKMDALGRLDADMEKLQAMWDRITLEGLGFKVNWNSHMQLKKLFYQTLGIKPIRGRNSKGEYAPTVNREALEKLQMYQSAELLCRLILAMRDIGKQKGFLETPLDVDGRMRSSFNMAGTNTGRISSAANEFNTGTNVQNVAAKLRDVFVADKGKVLINVDLEQSDSRNLGAMIYEHAPRGEEFKFRGNTHVIDEAFASAYLDACESGDLHTTVCRMAWDKLDWPEDRSGWRAVADDIFYRTYSYRDMAKRLGHGTNFYGKPATMARHTKTDKSVIEVFQKNYFNAFPGIPWYHSWVTGQLKETSSLTTLYGRRRFFFGRLEDEKTLRDAIAYVPQSMTAHSIDMAILQLYESGLPIELLNQVHDSVLFQVPWLLLDELMDQLMEVMRYSITLRNGREFSVPLEPQVGFNWGYYDEDDNPYGMRKWKGTDDRTPPRPQFVKRNSVKGLLT